MTSEEDTFKKLQKSSPAELLDKIFSLDYYEWHIISGNDELREKFLNTYHWTTAEWLAWLKENG